MGFTGNGHFQKVYQFFFKFNFSIKFLWLMLKKFFGRTELHGYSIFEGTVKFQGSSKELWHLKVIK